MRLTRPDYVIDLARLRSSRKSDLRAAGDNFLFEENAGSDRQTDFEAFATTAPGLRGGAAQYFHAKIEGRRRTHIPTTFQPMNAIALLPEGIEPVQKIVRLECIDDPMSAQPLGFDAIAAAIVGDRAAIAPLIREMNQYPGARPAFACFKAEVAADLREPNWAVRLMIRLGLGHYALAPGPRHYALMEYTVREVMKQATVAHPFAVPTVLESRGSEYFYPAPAGTGYGYTVDLADMSPSSPVREFLHIRLDYRPEHLVRVARVTGPATDVDLAAVRDGHLASMRAKCGRPDYGAPMSGEVDP